MTTNEQDTGSTRCPHCYNAPCLLDQGLYQSIVDFEQTLHDEDHTSTLSNKEIRFRLYRHVTSWIHGFLGKGRRIEIPVCVRGEILDIAPNDPGTAYVGFKE